MKRLAVPEIEDFQWCPRWFRDYMTDYLAVLFTFLNPYNPVFSRLAELLKDSGTNQIVDLCSGAGGPLRQFQRYISGSGCPARILLTDKYPHHRSLLSGPSIQYFDRSVDATSVPKHLPGARTLFTGLHHFSPFRVHSILKSAAKDRVPIAIFEITERNLRGILVAAVTPVLVLILTPLLRPFSIRRLLLTYLIPLLPLAISWDGLASMLKSYTPGELQRLLPKSRDYGWSVGQAESVLGVKVTYVIGSPSAIP